MFLFLFMYGNFNNYITKEVKSVVSRVPKDKLIDSRSIGRVLALIIHYLPN